MMHNPSPLTGQVAVVLGCSRYKGIGRAIALAFAGAGASLIVTGTGRDPSTLSDDERTLGWRGIDSLREEIIAVGGRCHPIVADVSSRTDIANVMKRTDSEFGRIDIVVNNFAASTGGDAADLVDVPEQVWRRYFEVNVHGLYYSLQEFGRYLISQGQGGRIINVSTVMAKLQRPRTGPYAATKAVMNVLTHVVAQEMGPHSITVNAICPGPVPTSRADERLAETGKSQLDRYGPLLPLGRLGTPDDIAAMALHLAGPTGSWITGQTFNVDGGMCPD